MKNKGQAWYPASLSIVTRLRRIPNIFSIQNIAVYYLKRPGFNYFSLFFEIEEGWA